jgi:hypothetical protein
MSDEQRSIPFRWILPVAQLLLCTAILWPLRGELIASVRSSTRAYFVHDEPREAPKVHIRVLYPDLLPPDLSSLHEVIEERAYRDRFLRLRLWGPVLLNLPAMWLDLPTVFLGNGKDEWVPAGMYFQYWRALAWPLVGILFWWVAGRGIEALIASLKGLTRPQITSAEIVVAILMVCLGGFGLVALIEADVRRDLVFPWVLLCAAGSLWFLLGSVIIASRVMQWRIRRGPAA